MQNTCTELKASMGHILNEAQTAETRIQKAIESMWQKMLGMLNHRVTEYKKQLASERAELDTTREQLSRAQAQEASLVHQNGRMSMELVAAEKREKKLEKQVSGLEKRLSTEAARFSRVEDEWSDEHGASSSREEGEEAGKASVGVGKKTVN
jgi:septal ring factor EnvC (AmiA/AmiB activator)